jgi:hypothetical protein
MLVSFISRLFCSKSAIYPLSSKGLYVSNKENSWIPGDNVINWSLTKKLVI